MAQKQLRSNPDSPKTKERRADPESGSPALQVMGEINPERLLQVLQKLTDDSGYELRIVSGRTTRPV